MPSASCTTLAPAAFKLTEADSHAGHASDELLLLVAVLCTPLHACLTGTGWRSNRLLPLSAHSHLPEAAVGQANPVHGSHRRAKAGPDKCTAGGWLTCHRLLPLGWVAMHVCGVPNHHDEVTPRHHCGSSVWVCHRHHLQRCRGLLGTLRQGGGGEQGPGQLRTARGCM